MPDIIAREFNLLPHPRILPMLGEINLLPWRCIAELIDNSVDAFLKVKRSGLQLQDPEISVSLPMSDDANAKVTIRDNGPGMDLDTLENAVRAGWTSNDPINNLGMFGMGFNIATARLGLVTRVWTTRVNDPEWVGLEINFETLIRQKHFKTPMLTRPKADPLAHGTEISVERLKPEQRQWISKGSNRSKIQRELSKAYSTMLRTNGTPLSFRLQLNGQTVTARSHCIWGGEGNPPREVVTSKYGTVSAYIPFDHLLADRPFCTACWQWLSAGEIVCPCCDSGESISQRQRRVRGWLGIQRYTSENEFGLDFLRNGRKIETANKDLFQWVTDGLPEEEYPIDDPRHRGRVVGEIHVDHCRVTYTKDRFDRNDPAWEEMVDLVRGQGPLRPDKAAELGFGPNSSPLFLLFQVFRRTSPKPKVAGCYKKLLIVPENERAVKMAEAFYDGDAEYQTDQKWWELVEEADHQLLVVPPVQQAPGGIAVLPGFGQQPSPPAPNLATPQPPPATPPPQRLSISSLTQEYRDDLTSLRWNVRAMRVQPTDSELSGPNTPWAMKKTPQGTDEFYVNIEHDVFRSATMTPLDALLIEMTWSAMTLQRLAGTNHSFATVLTSLRAKYAGISKLDPVILGNEAAKTLNDVARSLNKNLTNDESRPLFQSLTSSEQEAILQQMARRQAPQSIIDQGRFLEFAPKKTLLRFFEHHPELFFDGKYWDAAYQTIDYGNAAATEEARSQIVSYYTNLLTDAIWLSEQDPSDLAEASRARLVRASEALDLLEPGDAPDEYP
jgi:hypothetical protein